MVRIFYLTILVFSISNTVSFGQTHEIWRELRSMEETVEGKKPKTEEFVLTSYCIENQIDKYLDSIADVNRKAKLIRGYRLLIYSGNSREEATKAKEAAYRMMPNADVYTSYQSPTFKVKLGDFYQKLEAFLVRKKLQTTFPNAVTMEEVVNLKP